MDREATIDAVGAAGLNEALAELDEYVQACVGSSPRVLARALRPIAAAGKRLRATLCWSASHIGRQSPAATVPLLASIELLHLATLIHDDVVDQDVVRRGNPSIFGAVGLCGAIVAGDRLVASALLAALEDSPDSAKLLLHCLQELCDAQFRESQTIDDVTRSKEEVWAVMAGKTASLFAASACLGAGAAGVGDSVMNAVREYANNFGLAFQLLDDVQDLLAPDGDLSRGIYTLAVVLAFERDQLLMRQMQGRDDGFDHDAARVRIEASGAPHDVLQSAIEKLRDASTALPQRDDIGLTALRSIADELRAAIVRLQRALLPVVIVDDKGFPLDTLSAIRAHRVPGVLHKAVSVQVITRSGHWLVQRRASSKLLFAGRWSNSYCTHVSPDETSLEAAGRRGQEELGLNIAAKSLRPAGSFIYTALDPVSGYEEHEHDDVFVVMIDDSDVVLVPNPQEIADTELLSYEDCVERLSGEDATPWAAAVVEAVSNARHGLGSSDEPPV